MFPNRKRKEALSATITATTRELPATRDPIELNQRSTTIAALEHFAKQLFLSYDKWGTLGAERLRFRARTAREKGALCAFLYKVHQCHMSFYLHLRCEDGEERELLEGLGMPAPLFVGEDEEVYRSV